MNSHFRLRRTVRSPLPALCLTLVLVMAATLAPAVAIAQVGTLAPTATGAAPEQEDVAAPAPSGAAAEPEPTPVPDPPGSPETVEPAAEDAELTTVTLVATQDSYISSGFPNTNFAGTTNLNVGWQSGSQNAMRMLIQFDLSGLPRNAIINSAQYNIYQFQVIPVNDGPMSFRAQFMTQPWSESGVTWNNANFLGGDALPLGQVPGNVGWQSGDATGVVRTWASGQQPNFGLLITGDETPSSNRSRSFYSREVGGFAPSLTINYSTNCDTLPPISNVEPLPQFSAGEFDVRWTGHDVAPSGCNPSGIANFDVQYRINGGSWVTWKTRTTATSQTFKNYASNGQFVEFRVRATDNAGNVAAYPGPQASTTIDTQPPVATVNPLPQVTVYPAFQITWSGTDNLSGIANYDVEMRVDEGDWTLLLGETTLTSFEITGGQTGSLYEFRARATDRVGNVQSWPSDAQASTTVFAYPVAVVQPFNPNVLKPTAPLTDTFTVSWQSFAAPGTTITQYQIYWRYNQGGWSLWQNFPGTQTSAAFAWPSFGMGDGLYEFEATATNNLGEITPRTGQPEAGMIVDMANLVQPQSFMAEIFLTSN